jgi:hypothetical protein
MSLTPNARGSVAGITWNIYASGRTTPWSGGWTPTTPVPIAGPDLEASAPGGSVTLANPGEGDQTFTLTNDGNAAATSPTVTLTSPQGVDITQVSSSSGSWSSTGSSSWTAPAGTSIAAGGSLTVTAHLVADADGDGGTLSGTSPVTLTVLGVVAGSTPSASASTTVEPAWSNTLAASSVVCTGTTALGAGTVTVSAQNGSVAAFDAVVGGAGDVVVAGGGTGAVAVPVTYDASTNSPTVAVVLHRTVAGRDLASPTLSVPYTPDACTPRLTGAALHGANGTSRVPLTLANPSTVTVTASVNNSGHVAATGVHATLALPAGVSVASVGDGWAADGDGYTMTGPLAAGGSATLPVTLTVGGSAGAPAPGAASLGVTFASGNGGAAPLSATARTLVEKPFAHVITPGVVVCDGTDSPGTGTLTMVVLNASASAPLYASVPGSGVDPVRVAPLSAAKLSVPLSGLDGSEGGTVTVLLSRTAAGEAGDPTYPVPYRATLCAGAPVLQASGDTVQAANPSGVRATATVTNTGTATAQAVSAKVDLPSGYTVVSGGRGWFGLGSTWVLGRSLAPGESATLHLTLAVDVPGDASTGDVGVRFAVVGAPDITATATVEVSAESSWALDASATVQCTGGPSGGGLIQVTVTNRSSATTAVGLPGDRKVYLAPGETTVLTADEAIPAGGTITDGTVDLLLGRGSFSGTTSVAYSGVGCAQPAASFTVGQCTFDQSSQQSTAPVAILVDNRLSAVDLDYRVTGSGDPVTGTVAAGATDTVSQAVGEQGARFVVDVGNETFTLHASPVSCVPAWQFAHRYALGSRVTYGGDAWRLTSTGLGATRLSLLAPPDANALARLLGASAPWVDEGDVG